MTSSRPMWFFFFFLLSSANTVFAQVNSSLDDVFSQSPKFLAVDDAFQFDFEQREGELIVRFAIAEGYYLYQKQFKTTLKGVELGEPVFPAAQQIEDEFFGVSDVFFQNVEFSYSIVSSVSDGTVNLRFQGCAEAGLCYPPTIKQIYLNAVNQPETAESAPDNRSEQFVLADKLAADNGLFWTLAGFFGLGVLLAFTPCVFPMYPILSGIVLGGSKAIETRRAFSLSFIYVQGMAITYSILGLVVASVGVQFQAALQNPVLIGVFVVLFIVLAFAMFGAYELQLPAKWQERLTQISNEQKQGQYVGVFVMGMLSGLVASPCTTAPLTAILLYIAQSGDLVLGFVALYVLSLGMGLPLILFGVTGGKLLPKAGQWMNVIKTTFGFMLLAVAVFFLERVWVSEYSILLYSVLGLIAFSYYFVMNQDTSTSFMKGVRSLVIFVGLFTSALITYQSLVGQVGFPSAGNAEVNAGSAKEHPEFMIVKSIDDLYEKVAIANKNGQTVMVDLYADWCVACKEFEAFTFPDPKVINSLSNTVWMQIDLTHNTPQSIAFQEHFNILGLPTILFFDQQGRELEQARVTGFLSAEPFAEHVNQWLKE